MNDCPKMSKTNTLCPKGELDVRAVAGTSPAARQLVGLGKKRVLVPRLSGHGRSNPISACLRQQSALACRPPPDPHPA